jgi:hypothetical protein
MTWKCEKCGHVNSLEHDLFDDDECPDELKDGDGRCPDDDDDEFEAEGLPHPGVQLIGQSGRVSQTPSSWLGQRERAMTKRESEAVVTFKRKMGFDVWPRVRTWSPALKTFVQKWAGLQARSPHRGDDAIRTFKERS